MRTGVQIAQRQRRGPFLSSAQNGGNQGRCRKSATFGGTLGGHGDRRPRGQCGRLPPEGVAAFSERVGSNAAAQMRGVVLDQVPLPVLPAVVPHVPVASVGPCEADGHQCAHVRVKTLCGADRQKARCPNERSSTTAGRNTGQGCKSSQNACTGRKERSAEKPEGNRGGLGNSRERESQNRNRGRPRPCDYARNAGRGSQRNRTRNTRNDCNGGAGSAGRHAWHSVRPTRSWLAELG